MAERQRPVTGGPRAAVHVDDDGFVRAPAGLVYRRLTDVPGWTGWWPGVRVRRIEAAADEVVAWTAAAVGRGRRLELTARLHGWRHDEGFVLELGGDLTGRAEFWLEPGWGGTVVHHLVAAEAGAEHAAAVHTAYRRTLRRGLWALKDELEVEVRTGVSVTPDPLR